jgi:hypothetical protein
MFAEGTAAHETDLVWTSLRGGKTMRLHREPLGLLAIAALVFVLGSSIFYLREALNIPVQTALFAGPISPR